MNSMQPTSGHGSSTEKSELLRHLDSVAWAIFVIWIGMAMLVAMPWGWFLVGLGSHPGSAACSLPDEHQN
jgi:hypothetical protein